MKILIPSDSVVAQYIADYFASRNHTVLVVGEQKNGIITHQGQNIRFIDAFGDDDILNADAVILTDSDNITDQLYIHGIKDFKQILWKCFESNTFYDDHKPTFIL